jgi:hypothetical protein
MSEIIGSYAGVMGEMPKSTILIHLSVCASVTTGRSMSVTTERSQSVTTGRTDYVTGKRKVTVDAEKNDGKKMR